MAAGSGAEAPQGSSIPGRVRHPWYPAADTRARDEILELLAELSRDGLTVLLATHDVELTKYAATVLRIQDGLLEED